MGNSLSLNILQQEFFNNIDQIQSQSCTAAVESNTSNNTIIINNSTVEGDFGIGSQVTTDASCLMVSNMESSIESILKAANEATATTSSSLLSAFNNSEAENNVAQTIVNNISQVSDQLCNSSSINSTSNNYIYINNAKTKGFYGVSSKSQANSTCSMSNQMKATVYNQATSDSKASATTTDFLGILAGSLGGIIGLIAIVVILLFGTGALGAVGYEFSGSKKPAAETEDGEPITSAEDLESLESLENYADDLE